MSTDNRTMIAFTLCLLFFVSYYESQCTIGVDCYTQVVRLGQSCALTGPYGELGIEMRRGLVAAFEESNAIFANNDTNGAGFQFELHTFDDEYNATIARTVTGPAIIALPEIFGFIGSVGSATAGALIPFVKNYGIPYIGGLSGTAILRGSQQPFNDLFINYRASYVNEVAAHVNYFFHELGLTRISYFYQATYKPANPDGTGKDVADPFGSAGSLGINIALSALGLKLYSTGSFPSGTSNVARGIASITANGTLFPEAIVFFGTHEAYAQLLCQSNLASSHGTYFVSSSFISSNSLLTYLSENNMTSCGGTDNNHILVSQVVPLPYHSPGNNTTVSRLVKDYNLRLQESSPGAMPNFASLEGYIVGRMFTQIFLYARTDTPRGENVTLQTFLDALYAYGTLIVNELILGKFVADSDTSTIDNDGCNQGSQEVWLSRVVPDVATTVAVANGQIYYLYEDMRQNYRAPLCGATTILARPPFLFASLVSFNSSRTIQSLRGTRLAFNEANTAGGVLGRSLSLTLIDSRNPSAYQTVDSFVNNIFAYSFISAEDDETTLTLANHLSTSKFPLIVHLSGHQSLREPYKDHIVTFTPSTFDQLLTVITLLSNLTYSVDRYAIHVANADSLSGRDQVDAARKAIVSFNENSTLVTITDLSNSSSSVIDDSTSQVVFVFGSEGEIASVIGLSQSKYGSEKWYVILGTTVQIPQRLSDSLNNASPRPILFMEHIIVTQATYDVKDSNYYPNFALSVARYDYDASIDYEYYQGYMIGQLIVQWLSRMQNTTNTRSFIPTLYDDTIFATSYLVQGLTVGPFNRKKMNGSTTTSRKRQDSGATLQQACTAEPFYNQALRNVFFLTFNKNNTLVPFVVSPSGDNSSSLYISDSCPNATTNIFITNILNVSNFPLPVIAPIVAILIFLIICFVLGTLVYRTYSCSELHSLPKEVSWSFFNKIFNPWLWEYRGSGTSGYYWRAYEKGSEEWQRVVAMLDVTHFHGGGLLKPKTITAVYNKALTTSFVNALNVTISRLANSPEHFFTQTYKNNASKMDIMKQHYQALVAQSCWNEKLSVPIVPSLHGTDFLVARAIAETGFASLSSLDAGFFGKGIYFTTHLLYTLPYAVGRRNPAVIVSYLNMGNVFPVNEDHKSDASLMGTALKSGYNSHFVVTNRKGCIPDADTHTTKCNELVVAQESQILPAFIIELESEDCLKEYEHWTRALPPTVVTPLSIEIEKIREQRLSTTVDSGTPLVSLHTQQHVVDNVI